jgi:SagB-type dehydrogenase family enzyme
MSISSPSAALALVKAYHERTKHRFEAYAAGPQALDWDAQPAAFRDFDGAPQLALPRLADIAPGSALHAALERPLHALAPGGECIPIDLASIGVWLQLSLGITAWKSFGPDRWAVRANPSSGNLHPVEAYLLVSGIAGLSDGIHHYRPDCHSLELRAAHALPAGSAPRLAVILTTIMWREAWKYGERAFRYCQLDVGHAVAALDFAAGALGWTLSEEMALGNSTLARLCGTDRDTEFPVPRYPETEREEAELMLSVQLPPAPARPLRRVSEKHMPHAEDAQTPSPLAG